jgi:hypothetical protein
MTTDCKSEQLKEHKQWLILDVQGTSDGSAQKARNIPRTC